MQNWQNMESFVEALAVVTDYEVLATEITQMIRGISSDATHIAVYVHNHKTDELKLMLAHGFTEEEKFLAEKTAKMRHPGYVFRTGTEIDIDDTQTQKRNFTVCSPLRSFQVRSRIFFPLIHADTCYGTLGVTSTKPFAFTAQTKSKFRFIAKLSAIAYSNIINIESKKEVQEDLRLKERALDASNAGIIITRGHGDGHEIVYANRAFEMITGYTGKETKGKDCRFLNKGDVSSTQERKKIRQALKNNQICNVIIKNFKKDGTPFWNELKIAPVNVDCEDNQYYIGIQNDISDQIQLNTNLTKANERLSILIESLSDGIFMEKENGQVVLHNKTLEEMLGNNTEIAENASSIHKSLENLALDPQRFNDKIRKLIRTKKSGIGFTFKCNNDKTMKLILQLNEYSEHVNDKVWIVRDVTNETNREQSLIELQKKSEAAAEAKSQFLSNMSHEIRTPLNAIFGSLQILDSCITAEEPRRYLEMCSKASETVLQLINDVLTLSKMEAGMLRLEKTEVNISSLCESMLEIFEGQILQKELQVDFSQTIPFRKHIIESDELRIKQILFNLLGNALKFSDFGQKIDFKLTVKETRASGDANLIIEVRDRGIGIAKDVQEKLFTPFLQGDLSTTKKYGGTGLGLTLVKNIVDQFEGKIDFNSELGVGTHVAVTLPTKIVNKRILPIAPVEEKKPQKKSFDLEGKNILVVDDVEQNRIVVSVLLESLGATIRTANDGQEAFDKYKESIPDIVIMDIQMPVMDGFAAIQKIREFENQNNIVPKICLALTGYTDKDTVKKCKDFGYDLHLAKPIKKEDLFETLQHLLIEDFNEKFPTEEINGNLAIRH